MRVLYFGTYERQYPRNSQVISCLRGAGVDVVERHQPVWESQRHKLSLGVRGFARLLVAEAKLATGPTTTADLLIVGYPGHPDMRAARRIARGRPIVFNPLVSLEDTFVGDRRLAKGNSLTARAMRVVDRAAFREADLVVADTASHARYFAERFGLATERVAVCFVGADDSLFRPASRPPADDFHALFVGKLIPLHGLETILEAARQCPEIQFRVVGSGQLQALLDARSTNVQWAEWVDYEALPELYRSAGCALGIFGTSEKAARVIPNKAYQALACGTPLVTSDTSASRELLVDGESALLVPPGDPVALAAAVRRLAGDAALSQKLGEVGLEAYRQHASEAVLGARWRDLLERVARP